MLMKKYPLHKFTLILLILTGLLCLFCKNPFKEERKKERIIILVDDYLGETGRYIFYWEGKNDKKQYIEPGEYIVLLEIKNWQDQTIVTAQKGGKEGANNESRFEPGYWMYHDLEDPYPDPFKIKDGVNIPVLISEPARIILSVYKK